MSVKQYLGEHVNLVLGLQSVRHSLRLYKYSLLASLLISVALVFLLVAYGMTGSGPYMVVDKVFTVLVCLVAVDIVSLIFFAMWVIDSIELFDYYTRFCREAGECAMAVRVERFRVVGLVDYPLWLIILYVVGATFTTSAAYIVMILIKYGYMGGPLMYEEGVLASNLLYILGLILGAASSLLMALLLSRFSEYIGVRTLYVVALVFSSKYLVDLASLVYNMSLAANIVSIMLTGFSLYWIGRLFKGLALAEKHIMRLGGARKP